MPTWTQVAQQNGIPYTIPTSTGDLTKSGDDVGISRQGIYKQTQALPGNTSNLPTTYSAPGEGTVEVPYRTVDTTATRVPNNQLSGTPNPGSLSGVSNAGYLPSSRDNPVKSNGSTLPGISGTDLKASREIKNTPLSNPFDAQANKAVGQAAEVLRGSNPLNALNKSLERVEQANANGGNPITAGLGGLLDPDGKVAEGLKNAGDFLGGLPGKLGKLLGGNPETQRKGNRLKSPFPSDGQPDAAHRQNPSNIYRVFYATSNSAGSVDVYGGNTSFVVIKDSIYTHYYLRNTNGGLQLIGDTIEGYSFPAPTITGVQKLGGAPDPKYTPPAPTLNPDGSPQLQGLTAPQGNSSPTIAPANAPQPANEPTSQKAPQAEPQVKPGKNPDTEPKTPRNPDPTPSSPFFPIPVPIPNITPGQAPNSSPSANVTAQPLNPLAPFGLDATQPKAPSYSETPGIKSTPETLKQPTPTTPNEEPGNGDKCCPATQADLSEIKKVLGVGEFPATLPLLTADGDRLINNIPDLMLWTNSNLDAVGGFFPATVKVVQPDSSEKEFKLMNIGHAFEELFAAVLTMAEDADAAVNIGARIATEVVQTKVAVHQGNEILAAMHKFLGFAMKPMARIIKLNFSPTATGLDGKLQNDEMQGFLKPSSQSYVGHDLDEKQAVLPMLQRMLQNTEIARMAVWHPLKPGKHDEDNITGTKLRDRRTKPTEAEKKAWAAKLKILKDAGYEIDDNSPGKGSTK